MQRKFFLPAAIIISVVLILAVGFYMVAILIFPRVMQNSEREPGFFERSVISTVMFPMSQCLESLDCLLSFQFSYFYGLYTKIIESPEMFYFCDSPTEGGPRVIVRKPIENLTCEPFDKNAKPQSTASPEIDKKYPLNESGEADARTFLPSEDVTNSNLWKEISSNALGITMRIPKDWVTTDIGGGFAISSPETVTAVEKNRRNCANPQSGEECVAEVPGYDMSISKNQRLSPESMSEISIVVLPDRRVLEYVEIFSMVGFTHYVVDREESLYDLALVNGNLNDTALTILSTLAPSKKN